MPSAQGSASFFGKKVGSFPKSRSLLPRDRDRKHALGWVRGILCTSRKLSLQRFVVSWRF